MDVFSIQGQTNLHGEITVGGAKNAALPIMAASLLSSDQVVVRSVPQLADISGLATLLEKLGAQVNRDQAGVVRISNQDESCCTADYESVRRMRASICVLGPLLAKRGYAKVSMPGGCAIGDRPVNLHLRGLEALGAKLHLEGGYIIAECPRLRGAEIFLGGPFGSTVLGTANVMSAACLAQGTTVIEAAACEPEIVDLGNFLNSMGAAVTGHGSPRITIEGVDQLGPADYSVIPDRIEAGTFMVAAAITNSTLTIRNCRTEHLMAFIDCLEHIGLGVQRLDNAVKITPAARLKPVDVATHAYPGFPTDLQAQLMALLALADGNSIVTEKIFPDRFMHVPELNRMAANLRKEGPTVIIAGVDKLIAAPVMASDLRASAALVLAALAADGTTVVNRVYHIDRGYQRIEEKLNAVGARIERQAM